MWAAPCCRLQLQEQRELAAAQALAATREAQRQARAEEADSRTEEEEAAIKAAQQAAAERAAELKRRRAEVDCVTLGQGFEGYGSKLRSGWGDRQSCCARSFVWVGLNLCSSVV